MSKRAAMTNTEKESPQQVLNFVTEDQNSALDSSIRRVLNDSIKRSQLSRDAIVEEMSRITTRQITVNMLNACTDESHPHRFPLEWVPAWTQATGDWSLFYLLTDALGLPRPTPKDAALLDFAKHKLDAELATERANLSKTNILLAGGPR